MDAKGMHMELNVQFAEHEPPVVTRREFVYLELSIEEPSLSNPEDHKWTILTRETEHPSRPVRDTPVRALSRTTMILDPRPPATDGLLEIPATDVTLVAWVDPCGRLPASVVKLYKTVLGDRLAFIKATHFV